MTFDVTLDSEVIKQVNDEVLEVAAYAASQFNHVIEHPNGTHVCLDLTDELEPTLLSAFNSSPTGDLDELWTMVFDESGEKVVDCLIKGEGVDAETALEFINDFSQLVRNKKAA